MIIFRMFLTHSVLCVTTDPAYIFEIKVRKKFNEMEGGLRDAYTQIMERGYEEGILDEGYAGVVSYGVCFCKKNCILGLKTP